MYQLGHRELRRALERLCSGIHTYFTYNLSTDWDVLVTKNRHLCERRAQMASGFCSLTNQRVATGMNDAFICGEPLLEGFEPI